MERAKMDTEWQQRHEWISDTPIDSEEMEEDGWGAADNTHRPIGGELRAGFKMPPGFLPRPVQIAVTATELAKAKQLATSNPSGSSGSNNVLSSSVRRASHCMAATSSCGCIDAHNDHAFHVDFITSQKPGPAIEALQCAVHDDYVEEWLQEWDELPCPTQLLLTAATCSNLTRLTLNEVAVHWLPDIVETLARPELLKAVDLTYPPSAPLRDWHDRVDAAMESCGALEVVEVSQDWGNCAEVDGSMAMRFVLNLLRACCRSIQAVRIHNFGSLDTMEALGLCLLLPVTMSLAIRRLEITPYADGILAAHLIERCADTLEYLVVDGPLVVHRGQQDTSAAPSVFKKLSLLDRTNVDARVMTFAELVSSHWVLPAVECLKLNGFVLDNAREAAELEELLRKLGGSLQYLRVRALVWRDELPLEGMAADWDVALEEELVDLGMDAEVILEEDRFTRF